MEDRRDKMRKETSRFKIYLALKEILNDNPSGLRYSNIVKIIKERHSEIPVNTIHGTLWEIRQNIVKGKEKEISLPERGVYILSKYLTTEKLQEQFQSEYKVKEEDFYKLFADYLMYDLEECTRAIALGGNKFGDKWGTPDVIGVYKFSEADPIKPPLEIISAEIKIDTTQLITAFGQACAYKLFSHKVYLVIPMNTEQDIRRIESLCLRFGLGLIIFDAQNPNDPKFTIRTRAVKSEPDYFYVNKYIQLLGHENIRKLLY
jgi:hypothetical protein